MEQNIEAPTGVETETPAEFAARRDKAIQTWLDAKETLEPAKTAESEARQAVATMLFTNPRKGTNRYHLNAGYAVKLVYGTNYTLGDKDKVDVNLQEKIPVEKQVREVLEAIAKLGNAGPKLAEELVKWKPELNEKAYLALDSEDETEAEAKRLIDTILTSKPATPQLSFEVPKEAKA